MRNWRLIILIALGIYVLSSHTWAQTPNRIPARREPVVRTQPNGDSVTICLRGDERKHWLITTDGWEVQENKKGYICYAKKYRGTVIVSRRVAKDPKQRNKYENKWLIRKGVMKTSEE